MLHYRTTPREWAETVPKDNRFFIETAFMARKRGEREQLEERQNEMEDMTNGL